MATINERGEWTPFRGGHTCSDGSCSCDATPADGLAAPLAAAPLSTESGFTEGWVSPPEFQA